MLCRSKNKTKQNGLHKHANSYPLISVICLDFPGLAMKMSPRASLLTGGESIDSSSLPIATHKVTK